MKTILPMIVVLLVVSTGCAGLEMKARVGAPTRDTIVVSSDDVYRKVHVRILLKEPDGYPVEVIGAVVTPWDARDGWGDPETTGVDGTATVAGRGTFDIWITYDNTRIKRSVPRGAGKVNITWEPKP